MRSFLPKTGRTGERLARDSTAGSFASSVRRFWGRGWRLESWRRVPLSLEQSCAFSKVGWEAVFANRSVPSDLRMRMVSK